MGDGQLLDVAGPTAQLHDTLAAQLLQSGLPSPARDLQAFLWRAGVMLQEGKERREGALVARKRELSSTVYDANAHRAALGVVGQCEEDVLLPAVADEEASKRRLPQHTVGVLYTERAPVETTAFEFRCCGRDDIAVFLAGEGGEVGPL